jgi:hypothetical protein
VSSSFPANRAGIAGLLEIRSAADLGSAAFAATTVSDASEKTIHLDHFM